MIFKLGPAHASFAWSKKCLTRSRHMGGVDISRIVTYFEIGSEDTGGGVLRYVHIGRFSMCFRWFDKSYTPDYWTKQDNQEKAIWENIKKKMWEPPTNPTKEPKTQAVQKASKPDNALSKTASVIDFQKYKKKDLN